ncbi:MAG: flagellar protein FlgN [Selenomonadaceae bacterium]|nr:flagellar protein FlgN [Selenomonadaceae bacterium]
MDEMIKLLREQTVLCSHMPELFGELIKILRSNSPDVQQITNKIEVLMKDLSVNEKKVREFLKRVNSPSMAEYLNAQEKNIQRDVAENLLIKSADAQQRLKKQIDELKLLVQNGKNYVEFNLNILARISASDTYGHGAQMQTQRTRRMFEANV